MAILEVIFLKGVRTNMWWTLNQILTAVTGRLDGLALRRAIWIGVKTCNWHNSQKKLVKKNFAFLFQDPSNLFTGTMKLEP